MSREASCPSCGAPIEIRSAVSLVVTCETCGVPAYRTDADLRTIGQKAEVAAIRSALSLHARGRFRATLDPSPDAIQSTRTDPTQTDPLRAESAAARGGSAGSPAGGGAPGRSWIALGFAQFDHGKGPWNEWFLGFEDGAGGGVWLAEAQGQLLLTEDRDGGDAPDPTSLTLGERVTLAGGSWTVTEVGLGRVTAVRGELPLPLVPGASFAYADLRGGSGRFATVSESAAGLPSGPRSPGDAGGRTPADTSGRARIRRLAIGRRITLGELGVDQGTVVAAGPRRVATDRFACPSCGHGIALRDPEGTRRFSCPACFSLLDRESDRARVLAKQQELAARSALPIGGNAVLDGKESVVLAQLVRSVKVGGVRYAWREYLLRDADGAYRWLVESGGHWSLTRSVDPADVSRDGAQPGERGRSRTYRGRRYRHFQSGAATVDFVQGEVYWEVAVGETVTTHDFLHTPADGAPSLLAEEWAEGEVNVSELRYVPHEELVAAFGAGFRRRTPSGVAPTQPNRWAPRRGPLFGWYALFAALLLLVTAFRSIGGGGPAFAEKLVSAGETWVSDPFEVRETTDVAVHLAVHSADVWFSAEGTLHETATGTTYDYAVEANHWGTDFGDDPMGGGRNVARLPNVPPGRYVVRAVCSASTLTGVRIEDSANGQVVVRPGEAEAGFPCFLLVLLGIPPLLALLAASAFENRRWSESDHPPGGV